MHRVGLLNFADVLPSACLVALVCVLWLDLVGRVGSVNRLWYARVPSLSSRSGVFLFGSCWSKDKQGVAEQQRRALGREKPRSHLQVDDVGPSPQEREDKHDHQDQHDQQDQHDRQDRRDQEDKSGHDYGKTKNAMNAINSYYCFCLQFLLPCCACYSSSCKLGRCSLPVPCWSRRFRMYWFGLR